MPRCSSPTAEHGIAQPCDYVRTREDNRGSHAAGRALSATVHANLPEADGFLFPSRFTGHACVAVFERAFGKLTALDIADLAAHVEFLDALDDYDIVLTEAPGSRG